MNDPTTETERKTLLVSTVGCLIIGTIGVISAAISASQAIVLDGLFNLVYFVTGLFTLKVSRLLQRGDDEQFPYGYGFFEPLVNGLKGLLVAGVSLMALADAGYAIIKGGRDIEAGFAIGYALFATAACWTLAAVARRGARQSGSPLVDADAQNWLVNGAVSTAALLAFLSILLLRGSALDFLVPYVDPVLVVTVVLISISVPVRMAWQSLMELLNRTPSPALLERVNEVIQRSLGELPVRELFVRVIQPGRTRMIGAHVVLPPEFEVRGLAQLDALRARTLQALRGDYPDVVLDLFFTADRWWGAPRSEQ